MITAALHDLQYLAAQIEKFPRRHGLKVEYNRTRAWFTNWQIGTLTLRECLEVLSDKPKATHKKLLEVINYTKSDFQRLGIKFYDPIDYM